MEPSARLTAFIKSHPKAIGMVVDYDAGADRLLNLDFTDANTELTPDIIDDTGKFSQWVSNKLKTEGYRYGIGGYMEHRTIYTRSALFDTTDEPRRLHLGVDIWADPGTPVYSPLNATVHSFNNNATFGDYGPTIILQHTLDGLTVYSLYGHLNTASLNGLHIGKAIDRNQQIGELGNSTENGHWPPHLHFQLMFDMEGKTGDYPGVGRFSQKDIFLKNIPDPNLILGFPVVETI